MNPTDGEVLLPCRCGNSNVRSYMTFAECEKCDICISGRSDYETREMWNLVMRPAPQAGEAVDTSHYKTCSQCACQWNGDPDVCPVCGADCFAFTKKDAEAMAQLAIAGIEHVRNLNAAPQGVRDAWVSVKDGLPECGGKYWCVVRFKARYNGAICTRPAHRKYRALDFDVEKQGFWLDNGMPQEMITHWMKAEKMPPHESAPPAMSEGGGE